MRSMLAALALLAAWPATAAEPSPAEIEKAERAFAADGLALGMRDAFLKHMADDAIVFRPGPVSAKAVYEKRLSDDPALLEWWPQKVVIARSGDLGLSVGPVAMNRERGGYYATIWRKGPNDQWKWIYDGGAEAPASEAPGPETPPVPWPTATLGSASPATALAAVRNAEDRLAKAATGDASKAYRAALAADAWLTGPAGTEDMLPSDLAGRIGQRPPRMAIKMGGGGASAAGDLVWTYGTAGWVGDSDTPIDTHYMHVWQRRPEGWRLIFETLNTDT